MKKKKDEKTIQEVLGVNFEKKYDFLVFNGKYYEFSGDDGKPILKEVKGVPEMLDKSHKIAKKIKDSLDREKLLVEILMTKFDKKGLDKLYNLLFKSKRKYKPKTREDHCVDMKVGNIIIPLSE